MGHGMKYIMGHGNEVNHKTWECSKIMGHGNEVNHGHGNEVNHGTW
jgi:hypothetical protein